MGREGNSTRHLTRVRITSGPPGSAGHRPAWTVGEQACGRLNRSGAIGAKREVFFLPPGTTLPGGAPRSQVGRPFFSILSDQTRRTPHFNLTYQQWKPLCRYIGIRAVTFPTSTPPTRSKLLLFVSETACRRLSSRAGDWSLPKPETTSNSANVFHSTKMPATAAASSAMSRMPRLSNLVSSMRMASATDCLNGASCPITSMP